MSEQDWMQRMEKFEQMLAETQREMAQTRETLAEILMAIKGNANMGNTGIAERQAAQDKRITQLENFNSHVVSSIDKQATLEVEVHKLESEHRHNYAELNKFKNRFIGYIVGAGAGGAAAGGGMVKYLIGA